MNKYFPTITLTFDKSVIDGCSKKRPDVLLDMGDYVMIIEIDENQHRTYDCSCDNKRLMEIFKDCGNRPLVMIRFNPDQYYNRNGESVSSCWGLTKDKGLCVIKDNKKKEWANRLETLANAIKLQMNMKERKEIDVVHLFYDENLKK